MKKFYSVWITAILAIFVFAGCAGTKEASLNETGNLNETSENGTNSEATDLFLTEPPELTISYDGEVYSVLKGGYSWMYENGDGTLTDTVADAEHPLGCQDFFSPVYINEDSLTVTFIFEAEPDEVLVRCWSDEYWGDYENAAEETIEVEGMAFELKADGGYIYQIVGTWDSLEGCGGLADYSFYAAPEDFISETDTETAEEEFLAVLDECAGVWPGSAGSSLRGARAAGLLLDWAQTWADQVTSEQIEDFVDHWAESRPEDELANLREAWESVAYSVLEMATDPTGQADLLEDAGYTLQFETYRTEAAETVVETVEAALRAY